MADTRTPSMGMTPPACSPEPGGPGKVFPLGLALAMAVAGFLCGYGIGIVSGLSDRGMVTAFLVGGLLVAFGTGWLSGRMTEAGEPAPDADGSPPAHRMDDGEVPAGGGAVPPCLSGPAAPWGRAGSGIPAVALGGSSVSLPPRP